MMVSSPETPITQMLGSTTQNDESSRRKLSVPDDILAFTVLLERSFEREMDVTLPTSTLRILIRVLPASMPLAFCE